MKTLLLNQSYEPLMALSWKRAFLLVYLKKAESISFYDEYVHSAHEVFAIPAVIRLFRRVKNVNLISSFSRRSVYDRDNYICQYCGINFSRDNLTLDHVFPKSRGGQKRWENIVTACRDCNNEKGDRTPEEANMSLLKKPRKPMFIRKNLSPVEWEPFLWG